MHKLSERITYFILAFVLCFSSMTFAAAPNSCALTGGYMCGYDEEHTHTEACYKNVLVCGKEEHIPLCGKEEHLHNMNCCKANSVLVCALPEHEHTEFCFDTDGSIVCGMTEHTHTPECYFTEYVLNCSKEEHSHTDACIPHDENGKPCEIHAHTASCWQRQCVCGKQEHKHDPVLCMFKSLEGLENEAVWEKTIPFASLNGNWSHDLLTVAESQVGYMENYNNAVIAEDGKTRLGYTRYGHWFGYPYGDWCAMFAVFCMHYAGIPSGVIPTASGVETWIQLLEQKGIYTPASEYIPVPGDFVFIADDGIRPNHMGIAVSFTPNEDRQSGTLGILRIIQGNKDDAVKYVDIALPSYSVVGYVSLANVYSMWLNRYQHDVGCGTDLIRICFDERQPLQNFGNVVAIRSSESSEIYAKSMVLANNYMSRLNSDPSKLDISIFEVAAENNGIIYEIPQPKSVEYVSGKGTEPVTACFSVDGRLVIMICR